MRSYLPRTSGLICSWKPQWTSQAVLFSGEECIRLVSLLVTFAAIWARTCVCPASPAGQGLCRAFADASFGLRFCDSCHLLVICPCSGVRGFHRIRSLTSLHEGHWLRFPYPLFLTCLGPGPSPESGCPECKMLPLPVAL